MVRPTDWLSPYDTDLNDTSAAYRQAWGSWVVAKLERVLDGIAGLLVEVHAPSSYVDPIGQYLNAAGAYLVLPLTDVPWEEWPNWYDQQQVP